MPEPDYDIPDDFMKFSNNVYNLLTDRFNVPPHCAQAGLNGLLRFFHRHGRRNLHRMTLDIWVGQRDNPNRQEAEMSVQYDLANDLRNIINHLIFEGQQVTPETVEHELVERFGIRARGRKKPKKHTRRRRSRHRRSRHKKSRRGRSRHQKRKHKKTRHKR